jgi:hypothetical protein
MEFTGISLWNYGLVILARYQNYVILIFFEGKTMQQFTANQSFLWCLQRTTNIIQNRIYYFRVLHVIKFVRSFSSFAIRLFLFPPLNYRYFGSYPLETKKSPTEIMTSNDEDVRMPDKSESNDTKNSGKKSDAIEITSEQDVSISKPQQQPQFPRVRAVTVNGVEYRRVRCPPHRYTPLRENWQQILTPLVEYLKLQVRGL